MVDAAYERGRPHGTPLVYGRLLSEKLILGLEGIDPPGPGETALTVCGGSGMEAELLARRGYRVASADLSPGATRRATERFERVGLSAVALVADTEQLPFEDSSFDLVYVHDGLHHLADPLRGLAEMARVAARAVSVNEPTPSPLTTVAMRLSLAQVREESGNPVRRLAAPDLERVLAVAGFDVIGRDRYALLYRHEAGPLYRFVSRRHLSSGALALLRGIRRGLGPVGNKLSLRAVATSDPSAMSPGPQ